MAEEIDLSLMLNDSLSWLNITNTSTGNDNSYWDDIELESAKDIYMRMKLLRVFRSVFDYRILPGFIVIGFIVNSFLLAVTCRKNIKRYHYTFTYYQVLAVMNFLSLMMLSYQLHYQFATRYPTTTDFICKFLNFIHHCTIHSYGYIMSAVVFERCLIIALVNREKFGKKPTNSIEAARREMGSDWLGAMARRFCNQWATTLTIILIFLGIGLNNLWVWWTYVSVHKFSCSSVTIVDTAWQYSFRLSIWLLPSLFIAVCNIILIYNRMKRRNWEREQLKMKISEQTKIEEIQSVSGGTAQTSAAAEFSARVQGSYETEFSGSKPASISQQDVDPIANYDSTTVGHSSAGRGRMNPWSDGGGHTNRSWEKAGDSTPSNNGQELRATWKADDQTVEISTQAPAGLNVGSLSMNNGSTSNMLVDYGITDLEDAIKQDSLTVSLHSISIGLLSSELPNIIAHAIWKATPPNWNAHIHVASILLRTISTFLVTFFFIAIPLILFCFHRAVVTREMRVMWGEVMDTWESCKTGIRKPTLFNRGLQSNAPTNVDEDELVVDMETI